jgi:hypothetical protein
MSAPDHENHVETAPRAVLSGPRVLLHVFCPWHVQAALSTLMCMARLGRVYRRSLATCFRRGRAGLAHWQIAGSGPLRTVVATNAEFRRPRTGLSSLRSGFTAAWLSVFAHFLRLQSLDFFASDCSSFCLHRHPAVSVVVAHCHLDHVAAGVPVRTLRHQVHTSPILATPPAADTAASTQAAAALGSAPKESGPFVFSTFCSSRFASPGSRRSSRSTASSIFASIKLGPRRRLLGGSGGSRVAAAVEAATATAVSRSISALRRPREPPVTRGGRAHPRGPCVSVPCALPRDFREANREMTLAVFGCLVA